MTEKKIESKQMNIEQIIKEYLRNKEKIEPEIRKMFIDFNNLDEAIVPISRDLENILKNAGITIKLGNEKIKEYLKVIFSESRVLYSGSILYILDLVKGRHGDKAFKKVYFFLLKNILSNLLYFNNFLNLDNQDKSLNNKKFIKDIAIIVFFSLIFSIAVAYIFYTYLGQYFS